MLLSRNVYESEVNAQRELLLFNLTREIFIFIRANYSFSQMGWDLEK